MKLTVVGCAGSFAGPQSPASCYLIQADDDSGRTWNVVLDLGSGSFGALQNFMCPFELDAVLISHMHPDHSSDLTGLSVYRSYHPERGMARNAELPPLSVYGPSDIVSRYSEFHGKSDTEARPQALNLLAWEIGVPITIGPFSVVPYLARHPVPAVCMRITGPGEVVDSVVLTYSGDTDICEGLASAASGANSLLCEAAFVEGRDDDIVGIHLTGRRAGAVAQAAGVGELLLTHIPAWNDPGVATSEARGEFTGTIREVAAGTTYSI